jgi:hypothetical protein
MVAVATALLVSMREIVLARLFATRTAPWP